VTQEKMHQEHTHTQDCENIQNKSFKNSFVLKTFGLFILTLTVLETHLLSSTI